MFLLACTDIYPLSMFVLKLKAPRARPLNSAVMMSLAPTLPTPSFNFSSKVPVSKL